MKCLYTFIYRFLRLEEMCDTATNIGYYGGVGFMKVKIYVILKKNWVIIQLKLNYNFVLQIHPRLYSKD